MKLPAAGFTPPERSIVMVAKPELNFDFAGSTFQTPTSELAAKPACGSAVANSAREKTRLAFIDPRRVMGVSMVRALRAPCSDGRVHRLDKKLVSTRSQGRETARSG